MLKKIGVLAVTVIWAMCVPLTATANVADTAQVTTKRVVVRFVEKRQIKSICGARARACAYTKANIVILPEDRAYGWTGTRTARIRVRWHDKAGIKLVDCENRYACVKDKVVHARNVDFNHRGLVWLGEAYAKVIGLQYNPRRLELLAHELKHVLTGERDHYSNSNKNYRAWKRSLNS